jgi:hypothetical protein
VFCFPVCRCGAGSPIAQLPHSRPCFNTTVFSLPDTAVNLTDEMLLLPGRTSVLPCRLFLNFEIQKKENRPNRLSK